MFRFLHFMYSDFISEAATSMNDPSLSYEKPESSKTNLTPYRKINVKKTEFAEVPNCPIYNTLHRRNECRKPLKKGNKYYVITTCVTNAVSRRHMCIKLCPETINKCIMEALQDLSMGCQHEPRLDLMVGSSHPEALLDLTAGKQI